MNTKPTHFKRLLAQPKAILLPVVHDCLAAKIAESVGFAAVSVGGFATAGVNYGLPDVGLLGLSDMLTVIKNIVSSTRLPVFADADDGYGNGRNVAHTVAQFEAAGVASLFIEDQRHPKRCGHLAGKDIISLGEMVDKIHSAVAARSHPDLTICARTDAIAVEGFPSAITRAKDYIRAGADIIFIEAPTTLAQLRAIPKLLPPVPLLVNMLEGGKTPILPAARLENLGYKLIAYPVTALFSSLLATRTALEHLKVHGLPHSGSQITFNSYKQLVELDKYL